MIGRIDRPCRYIRPDLVHTSSQEIFDTNRIQNVTCRKYKWWWHKRTIHYTNSDTAKGVTTLLLTPPPPPLNEEPSNALSDLFNCTFSDSLESLRHKREKHFSQLLVRFDSNVLVVREQTLHILHEVACFNYLYSAHGSVELSSANDVRNWVEICSTLELLIGMTEISEMYSQFIATKYLHQAQTFRTRKTFV